MVKCAKGGDPPTKGGTPAAKYTKDNNQEGTFVVWLLNRIPSPVLGESSRQTLYSRKGNVGSSDVKMVLAERIVSNNSEHLETSLPISEGTDE